MHHVSVFLVVCSFLRQKHVVVFLSTKMKIGSQLLQKIDIFTSEDMENILLCIFSILLSTI